MNPHWSKIEECLNIDSLHFTTGGDAKWQHEFDETYDGVASMKSGAVGDSQTSWIKYPLLGRGQSPFDGKRPAKPIAVDCTIT